MRELECSGVTYAAGAYPKTHLPNGGLVEVTPSTNSIAFQENWRPAKPIPRFLEIAYLAGSLFGAGSDTTAVAITYVFMASACYPGKVQQKVQEQLDIVVSYDRVPTFDGYKSFPQIETFMFAGGLVYLDNGKFDPQRWLNSKGKIRHDIKFPYGFGRRYSLV
ncbi:hypothetical protein F4604DRAFT_1679017 [Suillus subluteus]|nr:hypothetical protein F4604DRAFT_1679017 [Suillus subluteus]